MALRKYVFILILLLGLPFRLRAEELTLEKAIDLAFHHNPQVLRFLSQLESVKARSRSTLGLYDWFAEAQGSLEDQDQARISVFQPATIRKTIYTVSFAKSFESATDFGVTFNLDDTKATNPFNLFNETIESELSFNLKQSLMEDFIGAPRSRELEQNKLRTEAQRLFLVRQMEQLAAQISLEYWSLWEAQKLYLVGVLSEKDAKDFLAETKRLGQAGLREKDDILQAEAEWLERQSETVLAQSKVNTQWAKLRNLLGVGNRQKWKESPQLEDPPSPRPKWSQEYLISKSENRRDLKGAEQIFLLNQINSERLRGKILPQLTVQGGYALLGIDPHFRESLNQIKNTQLKGWNIGMALSHSFGQNLDRSSLEFAHADLLAAKAAYQSTAHRVEFEIATAIENRMLAFRQLALIQKIENNRVAIRELFKEKFAQGRISIQDLLRADDLLKRARSLRISAQAAMASSAVNYSLAIGTYLDDLKLKPDSWIRARGQDSR